MSNTVAAHTATGPAANASPAHARIEICLLGSPRILVDGVTVTSRVKYRKATALLALLAVDCDIMHPRERIAHFLWPELERKSALTNLRQVLSNLIRVLVGQSGQAQSVIRTDNSHVGLFTGPELNLDVQKLIDRSTQIQKGSHNSQQRPYEPPLHRFLEGFDLADCLEFSTWMDSQRRRLDSCIVNLHEKAIAQAMARDNPDRAILHARLIERIDPLREANQVCLMRLLMETGQPKQALQQFELFSDLLREELDVDPEPATSALHQHILQRVATSTTKSMRPQWHFGQRTNTTVMYLACDAPRDETDIHGRAGRVASEIIRESLGQHGCELVDSHGLGLFAYFKAMHHDDQHAETAIRAAQAVSGQLACSPFVRIGIYTGHVENIEHPAHAYQRAECTELARRLGFVADDGNIVMCANTLGQLALEAEYLGEWRFRGINRLVHAYGLSESDTPA